MDIGKWQTGTLDEMLQFQSCSHIVLCVWGGGGGGRGREGEGEGKEKQSLNAADRQCTIFTASIYMDVEMS